MNNMLPYLKKAIPLVLAVLFFLTTAAPALAADTTPDLTKTDCTITLSFLDHGSPAMVGAEFTLYGLADVSWVGSTLCFDVSETAFAEMGPLPEDLDDGKLARSLAAFAVAGHLPGTAGLVDSSGALFYSGLTAGLYLVVQTKHVSGYCTIQPFLVAIPLLDECDGVWLYDVTGAPKCESELSPIPLPTEPPTPEDAPPPIEEIEFLEDIPTPPPVTPPPVEPLETPPAEPPTVSPTPPPPGPPDDYELDDEEPPDEMLIQTGQLNWPIPLLAEAGILLFVAGWLLIFAGRRKEQR